VIQEFAVFSHNINIIGTLAYLRGKESIYLNDITTYNMYAALTGIKIYMGSHFYSEFQLGGAYVNNETPNKADDNYFKFYGSFGLGYKIFKNFQ
jgi:hypothetical protein